MLSVCVPFFICYPVNNRYIPFKEAPSETLGGYFEHEKTCWKPFSRWKHFWVDVYDVEFCGFFSVSFWQLIADRYRRKPINENYELRRGLHQRFFRIKWKFKRRSNLRAKPGKQHRNKYNRSPETIPLTHIFLNETPRVFSTWVTDVFVCASFPPFRKDNYGGKYRIYLAVLHTSPTRFLDDPCFRAANHNNG